LGAGSWLPWDATMSAEDANRRLISVGDERREVDGCRPSIRDLAMLQELSGREERRADRRRAVALRC